MTFENRRKRFTVTSFQPVLVLRLANERKFVLFINIINERDFRCLNK